MEKMINKLGRLIINRNKDEPICSVEITTQGKLIGALSRLGPNYIGGIVLTNKAPANSVLRVPDQILSTDGLVGSEAVDYLANNVRYIFNSKIGVAIGGYDRLEDRVCVNMAVADDKEIYSYRAEYDILLATDDIVIKGILGILYHYFKNKDKNAMKGE